MPRHLGLTTSAAYAAMLACGLHGLCTHAACKARWCTEVREEPDYIRCSILSALYIFEASMPKATAAAVAAAASAAAASNCS
eukprot:214437-Heterocapsa_arctica.AAC.1